MDQKQDALAYWFTYRFRKVLVEEGKMTADPQQAIRERAYALWEQDGRPDGKALEYWLRAEAEMSRSADEAATSEGKLVRPSTD